MNFNLSESGGIPVTENTILIYSICLLIFVFQHAASNSNESCLVSLTTMIDVPACPKNETELLKATQRKQCKHLANIQSCTKPINFTYHCVLNTLKNALLEVCAPEIISQGFCLRFDEGGARLQEIYNEGDCTKDVIPCSTRFRSSNVTHYVHCAEKFNTFTTTTLTQFITTNKDSSNKNNKLFIGLIVAVVVLVLIVVSYICYKCQRNMKDHSLNDCEDCNQELGLIQEKEGGSEEPNNIIQGSHDCNDGNEKLRVIQENEGDPQEANNIIQGSHVQDDENGNQRIESMEVKEGDPQAQDNEIQGSKDQDFSTTNFKEELKEYQINDECIDKLHKHDIDCSATFCSMDESEFKNAGLSFGHSRKCLLVARRIKEKGGSNN